jgi:integrase
LRCGEIIALEWGDVDLGKRQLCVQRSEWRGHVTVPKGGRLRYVPMTRRVAAALREHRHLRSVRVICQGDGSPLTQDLVRKHMRGTARRAQIAVSGVHRLRHTFCSHHGDARGTGTGDSGARGTPGPLDHAAAYAPSPAAMEGRFDYWSSPNRRMLLET